MSVSQVGWEMRRQAGDAAERAHRSEWFGRLARWGFAAKAAVYTVVGVIAARSAFSTGEVPVGQKGAIREVSQHELATVMLVLLGTGLAAFALFQLISAGASRRHGWKGILARVGRAGTGVIHGALSFAAFDAALGRAPKDDSQASQEWTARVMAQPFGRYAVMAIGVSVIGFGLYQLGRAWKTDLWKCIDRARMSARAQKLAKIAGRGGFASRGIVFGIVGAFLFHAGFVADASESRGLPGALQALRESAGGPWLMGVVALGLVGYATYCLVLARWFRDDAA